MTTQHLVEVSKIHGYTCPDCEWAFNTEDGEDRDKPMTGYYFDTETMWRDEIGDIFSLDTKLIKGTMRTTCHRVLDDSDYEWCTIDMVAFEPTVCQGWKCMGCGAEVWYDNAKCTQHSFSPGPGVTETARKHLQDSICSCSKKPDAPAPVSDDSYAVGATLRINTDNPLSAGLMTGDIVTIRDVTSNDRISVYKDGGRPWIIEKSQGDPLGAVSVPAGGVKDGDKMELTVSSSDGVIYEIGEVVTVINANPDVTYYRIEKANGERWNLTKSSCKPYTELDPEIADKFVRKDGKKKVTVLDF